MLVIFTDLDGTLLDYDGYTWQRAGGSLQHVRARGVPLVFCSSKTMQEQLAYQREIEIDEPMVVESGGAVAVPEDYFSRDVLKAVAEESGASLSAVGEHRILALGRVHVEVREALEAVREQTGLPVRGITEISLKELMEATGLPEAQAMRARSRDFSEAVHLDAGPEAWDALASGLEERGFGLQGSGPLATVVDASTDKGRGVRVVRELFRRSLGEEVETVALGDGASDAPMFEAVDRAFLVERKGGGWAEVELPGLERVEGVGPHGWEPVVRELLDEPVRRSRPRAPR